jgi:ubiquinone/menaquinone biosynthesis C-methylase UbiE
VTRAPTFGPDPQSRKMQPDEYLKLADVEDSMWYFHALHGQVRRGLADLAAPNATVLDAGCGTGGLILKLRAEHPERQYSGIDFSPLAIELAQRRCGPSVDLRVASITALPFEPECFDAVISADVICQVDEPAVALAEFHRVLRPGGVVVINVPAYMWLWSYHDDSCQTKHRYVRRELAARLTEAGFTAPRTTHWNLFAFPLIVAKRKLFPSPRDTSDVRRYPSAIEATFRAMTALERGFLAGGGALPFGTSVFAVARKPRPSRTT